MGAIATSISANGDKLSIKFSGAMDEHFAFDNSALSDYNVIQIDLKEINRITSQGVRAWSLWLARLDQKKTYQIHRCSRTFLTQANIVKGLIPDWMDVKSIELPYYCAICDNAFGEMLDLYGDDPAKRVAPKVKCPECGDENAEFDSTPERYFQFLKRKSAGKNAP